MTKIFYVIIVLLLIGNVILLNQIKNKLSKRKTSFKLVRKVMKKKYSKNDSYNILGESEE